MRLCVLLSLFWCCGVSALAQPTLQELQAEIAELRRQIQELESYKARLEALEAKLKQMNQSQPPSSPAPVVKLSGFIQFRYIHDTALSQDARETVRGSARDTFRTRIVRLDGIAQPRPDTLYRVNLNAGERQVVVVDALVELRRKHGRWTVGLFRLPLLYETLESNADRLTPEPSQMVSVLFPTERDVGVAYTHFASSRTQWTLGLFTGDRSSLSQDSLTSRKSLLVRLHHQFSNGLSAWVGGMTGEGRKEFAPNTLVNYQRERYGAGVEWHQGALNLRAEAVWGRNAGTSISRPTVRVQGGYLLLWYTIPRSPLLVYGKYDTYDPNTSTNNDTFSRYALGLRYELNPATHLNLTYQTPIAPRHSEQWTLQLQVRY